MSDRYYPPAQLKILMSLAANECEYRGCNFKLVSSKIFLGTIAHITAFSPGGPRYDAKMTEAQRNANDNLMVLCRNHHALIDADVDAHPTELLLEMKAEHAKKVGESSPSEAVSETQLQIIVEQINSEQTNVNTGSGTQINNQQFVYNNAKEQDDHYKTVRRDINRYSDRIRVALRAKNTKFGDVHGLLNEIVIGGAYEALEAGDTELFERTVNELRKISSYCFVDDTYSLIQSASGIHLEVIEFIVNSCYEIGAYCIDKQHYAQLKFMVERPSIIKRPGTDCWLYVLTSTIYRARSYSSAELFGVIITYVQQSLGYRIGWTEDEAKAYLMQFEYLASLLILYARGKRDFPFHAAYYEEGTIYKDIENLLNDDALLQQAFPGLDKTKLASAIYDLDEWLSNHVGLGLGGFRWNTKLGEFVTTYAPQKQAS